MKREFIPYELALELKELGFNESCFAYLKPNVLTYEITIGEFNEFEYHSAPTYSQAFRWFREKHNLGAIVSQFGYAIENQYGQATTFVKENENPLSYEEAELECLKRLIKIAKRATINKV
jgi:hypothetical protein